MQAELTIMHVTSSRFYGGPERQMLGLAEALRPRVESIFVSFSETSLNQSFLEQVSLTGFAGIGLKHDTPRLLAASWEIIERVKEHKIKVLVCHGYKAGLVGCWAARRVGIPVVAVSRGWTAESRKIRVYEWLDRKVLKCMDRVVCVSQAQADKVRTNGIKADKIVVIPNAIDASRFEKVNSAGRAEMEKLFDWRPRLIVGAVGRLSPEKGFDLLVTAARSVVDQNDQVGFVLFGEGRLRESLGEQIAKLNLNRHFVVAGFRPNLDHLFPHFDLFAQSSHTEGMPNVILEALAAKVPVIATDAGGTRELIRNNLNGRLMTVNSADEIARTILEVLEDPELRQAFRRRGIEAIQQQFTFPAQARAYLDLFSCLITPSLHQPVLHNHSPIDVDADEGSENVNLSISKLLASPEVSTSNKTS